MSNKKQYRLDKEPFMIEGHFPLPFRTRRNGTGCLDYESTIMSIF